jgi:hypothetical protein
MAQTTITDFGASDADQEPSQDTSVDPTDFHREIPEDEFTHIGNGIMNRECVAADVAPSAISLLAGKQLLDSELGFHPDDQYREDQYSIEEEPDAVQYALANQHENHPTWE